MKFKYPVEIEKTIFSIRPGIQHAITKIKIRSTKSTQIKKRLGYTSFPKLDITQSLKAWNIFLQQNACLQTELTKQRKKEHIQEKYTDYKKP